MRFRWRTPHERLEAVIVKMLERDLRNDVPRLLIHGWTIDHYEGDVTITIKGRHEIS